MKRVCVIWTFVSSVFLYRSIQKVSRPQKKSHFIAYSTPQERDCYKKNSRLPVTVIPPLSVLVFALVEMKEQNFCDSTWKFHSSSSSGTFSIWDSKRLSLVGRSKTKHLRTGKKYLIHSLVMLDFWTLGLFPVREEGALSDGAVGR